MALTETQASVMELYQHGAQYVVQSEYLASKTFGDILRSGERNGEREKTLVETLAASRDTHTTEVRLVCASRVVLTCVRLVWFSRAVQC